MGVYQARWDLQQPSHALFLGQAKSPGDPAHERWQRSGDGVKVALGSQFGTDDQIDAHRECRPIQAKGFANPPFPVISHDCVSHLPRDTEAEAADLKAIGCGVDDQHIVGCVDLGCVRAIKIGGFADATGVGEVIH